MQRFAIPVLLCLVASGCFSEADDAARSQQNALGPQRPLTSVEPVFEEPSLADLVEPVDAERGCSGQAQFADGRPIAFAFLVCRLTLVQPPEVKTVSDHWYVSTVTDARGRFALTLPANKPFAGVVTAVDGRANSLLPRWETTVERAEPGKPLALTFDRRHQLSVVVNVAKPVPQLETLSVKLVMNSAASGEHEIAWKTLQGAGGVGFNDLSPGEYRVIVQASHPQCLTWTKNVTIDKAWAENVTIDIPEIQFGEVHVPVIEADGTTPARWGEVRVLSLEAPSARWSFQAGVAQLKNIPAGDQVIVISVAKCREIRVPVKVTAGTTTTLDPLTMETDPLAISSYGWNPPKADEKTPAEWLLLFEQAQTPSPRAVAASALGQLRSHDPEILRGLIAALYSRDRNVSGPAVMALNRYGPALDNALDDWLLFAFRQNAVENSYSFGFSHNSGSLFRSLQQSALPSLMVCLSDSRDIVRDNALLHLGELGPLAKPAVPLLRLIVANRRNEYLRAKAASVLSKITGDDAAAIVLLVQSLQLPVNQSGVWTTAAESLAKFGSRAKPAVPALIEILTGERETLDGLSHYRGPAFPLFHVRAVAAETLGRIGPDAKEAIPPLLAAAKLRFSDPEQDLQAAILRVRAARALARIDPNNPQTIQVIRAGFLEKSIGDHQTLQMLTAETIAELGPAAKDAVPELIVLLRSKDSEAARQSAIALGAIGPDATDAANALVEALAHPHSSVAWDAARALGAMGPKANAVLPKMRTALQTSDGSLKDLLSEAIRKIEQDSPPKN